MSSQAPSCSSSRAPAPRNDWRQPIVQIAPSRLAGVRRHGEPTPDPLDSYDQDDDEDTGWVEIAFVLSQGGPNTWREAMSSRDPPQWAIAFTEQVSPHERNGTWIVIDCPPGVRPIDCCGVLKIKRNADGMIKHYTARFVAKGFTQCILASTTSRPSRPQRRWLQFCTVLALSAALGLHLRSIDSHQRVSQWRHRRRHLYASA